MVQEANQHRAVCTIQPNTEALSALGWYTGELVLSSE